MKGFAIRLLVTALLLISTFFETAAQKESLPFIEGESLTYVVKYKWGAINTDVGELHRSPFQMACSTV